MSGATVTSRLKAPFPAFGGKSRIADLVWTRLGNVRNYVEPFCFSAAMLLLRPHDPQIETINDLNAFVANFWRAIQRDPEAVAAHADWPVNETDLHARHAWLVRSHEAAERLQLVRDDPEAFDAKIAGWWCWGACMWIGSGWCEDRGAGWAQMPGCGGTLTGVHNGLSEKLPLIGDRTAYGRGAVTGQKLRDEKRMVLCNGSTTYGQGVHKKPGDRQPALGQAGWGSNANGASGSERPQLADAYSRGRGVHGNDALTDCERRRLWLADWFTRLSDRLRPVRVCCGHWSRVCDSDSTLTRLGTTGVFLDPPYRKKLKCGKTNRAGHIYANDKTQDVDALVDEVQAWCLKWGGDKLIRIACCGLEGEYPDLDDAGWEKIAWKAQGGYGNRNGDNENAARERIWLSPSCVPPAPGQLEMFA